MQSRNVTKAKPQNQQGDGHALTRRDALRLLAGISGVGLASFAHPLSALATSQSEINSARSEADEAQSRLDEITSQAESISSKLSETMNQIDAVSGQIDQLESEIGQKQSDIEKKQKEIDEKQKEMDADREVLGKRMSSAFKAGSAGMLDLLFSSTSFEQFTSNVLFLDKISESENEMIQEVKRLQDELKVQRGELESQKAELETKKSDLVNQQSQLNTLKSQQQSQLSEIQSKQQEATELVDKLNSEVQDLISKRNAELLAAQQAAREGASYAPAIESGASGSQAAVVSAAYSTPSVGVGLCAAWVTNVFRNAGIGSFYGNACDMYWAYCSSSNTADIRTGMIIAVPTEPYSAAAILYGHIGIYVGNGTVRHSASGTVITQSLGSWISEFGVTSTPRWGWLGGVVLA